MNSSPVVIENLHRHYGWLDAVNGLSLEVPRGSLLALVGPNGAGKTTTLKVAMNLLRPSEGSVSVFGKDSRKLNWRDFQQIGYVSENQQLPDFMTVRQFLNFCRPMYPTWDSAFCAELKHQFKLDYDQQRIGHLSRGMRMKAALLSSLAYRPKLLVLDEPFSGLDAVVREDLSRAILQFVREEDWTILITSHDIDEIERLADRVAIMQEGTLTVNESVTALQERFRRVQVTLPNAGTLMVKLPNTWLQTEQNGARLCFVDSTFESEEKLKSQLPANSQIETLTMSLREIYIAIATKTLKPRVTLKNFNRMNAENSDFQPGR
ncbi:MAG: ABC transporter ATP-binding protein [Verrucomicrobiales bacterium]|jgi:ABC-2 type transport system ATP-binding protein|nr:ABC transporter ATP-binding protein [Verrucomicrobiales bacterium]